MTATDRIAGGLSGDAGILVPMSSSALHQAMTERVERREYPGMVTVVARGDDVRVTRSG